MYLIIMHSLAIVAIIAALGLMGVIVIETLIISQQINAVPVLTKGGCTAKGFTASNGKCPPGITNITNGRSFHP
jgi:hypothetical protein